MDIKELKNKIKAASGTEKVDLLNELGARLQRSEPNEAGEHARAAIELAKECDYDKGIADGCQVLGFIHWVRGDYKPAMEQFEKAQDIYEAINDKRGLAQSFLNIANCHGSRMDYDQSLECHLKSIALCEEIEDRELLATNYSDLSYVHWKLNDFDQALKYLHLALDTFKEMGNDNKTATTLNNIGVIYEHQENYDKALEYYKDALDIWERLGDFQNANMAHTYNNIGTIYTRQKDGDKSLQYYYKSLEIWEAIESKTGLAMVYTNIGETYAMVEDYPKAAEWQKKGLETARQIGDIDRELECCRSLAETCANLGNHAEACRLYKQFSVLREKAFGSEMSQRIAEMQTRYESDKNRREAELYRLKNVELAGEIKTREKAETELRKYRDHLEEMVKDRTAELEKEIAVRKSSEERLQHTTEELLEKSKALEDKNIALNQVLSHIENTRQQNKRQIYLNIETALRPFMARLKEKYGQSDSREMEEMEDTVKSILALDMSEFEDRYSKLSVREVEICKLIRKGLSSNQIGDRLHISAYTVKNHREKIRKKLGITNKDINLTAYLRSHETP